MQNPYEVLGCFETDDDATIKKAYRQLSKLYHPDNNVNNPNKKFAEEKFKDVQAAYEQIMSDRALGVTHSTGSVYGQYGPGSSRYSGAGSSSGGGSSYSSNGGYSGNGNSGSSYNRYNNSWSNNSNNRNGSYSNGSYNNANNGNSYNGRNYNGGNNNRSNSGFNNNGYSNGTNYNRGNNGSYNNSNYGNGSYNNGNNGYANYGNGNANNNYNANNAGGNNGAGNYNNGAFRNSNGYSSGYTYNNQNSNRNRYNGNSAGWSNSGYRNYWNGVYTSDRPEENNEALNRVAELINKGMFNEALFELTGFQNRSAVWYYYSAVANLALGQNIVAKQHAQMAYDMDPGKREYFDLYSGIQQGAIKYRDQNAVYKPDNGKTNVCQNASKPEKVICIGAVICCAFPGSFPFCCF